MYEPLFALPLENIPGIGSRMKQRSDLVGISTIRDLYNVKPKQLHALRSNDTGEKLAQNALHGYDVQDVSTAWGILRSCPCLAARMARHRPHPRLLQATLINSGAEYAAR